MSPGKAAAQACHASLSAYEKTRHYKPEEAKEWFEVGQTKIIVQVADLEAMLELASAIESDKRLYKRSHLVIDAGHTELKGNNVTALGIGPISEEIVDPITRKLLLYR